MRREERGREGKSSGRVKDEGEGGFLFIKRRRGLIVKRMMGSDKEF